MSKRDAALPNRKKPGGLPRLVGRRPSESCDYCCAQTERLEKKGLSGSSAAGKMEFL